MKSSLCVQFSIFGVGGYKIINGTMEIGELIAFNMYSQKMFTPIIRQIQSNLIIQNAIISLERVFKVMDEPIVIDDANDVNYENDISIKGKIEFKNLSFSYNKDKKVLDNANIIINPMENIAIIGESGVGKTSISNLLYRLWKQNSGKILIDNIPIDKYSIKKIRDNITIVSQDTLIFNDTLFNNITLGKRDITSKQVEDICKKVCIHDFIMSLPKGYDTKVGYSGDKLSGGQKQRICIARAFLRNTPILILDEVTSALDIEIQSKVMKGLETLIRKTTCIFITHRTELLSFVDNVYELKNGQLIKK